MNETLIFHIRKLIKFIHNMKIRYSFIIFVLKLYHFLSKSNMCSTNYMKKTFFSGIWNNILKTYRNSCGRLWEDDTIMCISIYFIKKEQLIQQWFSISNRLPSWQQKLQYNPPKKISRKISDCITDHWSKWNGFGQSNCFCYFVLHKPRTLIFYTQLRREN